jgi:hypothetical protein
MGRQQNYLEAWSPTIPKRVFLPPDARAVPDGIFRINFSIAKLQPIVIQTKEFSSFLTSFQYVYLTDFQEAQKQKVHSGKNELHNAFFRGKNR